MIWATTHHRGRGLSLEIIKELSVNMLILYFPIFIYHLFEQRIRNKHKLFIGIASGLAIILCMSFPIGIAGFRFDLRQIPLILSGLYGGVIPFDIVISSADRLSFLFRGRWGSGAFWINSILTCVMVTAVVFYRNKYTTSL